MENQRKTWIISEFSKELMKRFSLIANNEETVHYNTVSNWFNSLEEQGIHYVNKVDDIRQFDELDMKVALSIMKMRKEKIQMTVIYNVLPKQFDLRIQEPIKRKKDAINFEEIDIKEMLSDQLNNFSIKINEKNETIVRYLEISNQRSTLVSKKQDLAIEKSSLENKVAQIDGKVENLELRTEFINLKAVNTKLETVAQTKNKGFFARLFSAPESGESEVAKELPAEEQEKVQQIKSQLAQLKSEKEQALVEIDGLKTEIEKLDRDIEKDYSKLLTEVKEGLLIESNDDEFDREETVK